MKNRKMFGIRITGIIIAAVILLLSTPLAAMAEKEFTPDSSEEQAVVIETDEMENEETETPSIENTDNEEKDNVEIGNADIVNEEISNEEVEDAEILNEEPVNEEGETPTDNNKEENAATLPDDEAVKEDAESPEDAESDDPETEETKKEEISVTGETLVGTWTIDGTTTYQFEEDGRGALILPEHRYPFTYTVEADKLLLEFDNSSIGKAAFRFTAAGDALTLKREEETGTTEFILQEQESEEIIIE